MTDSENILGIYYWTDDDNLLHYRCRGYGNIYKEFYEWVKTTSYRCTSSDWPWDFFVFDDARDHQNLLEKFGAYVSEDYD